MCEERLAEKGLQINDCLKNKVSLFAEFKKNL